MKTFTVEKMDAKKTIADFFKEQELDFITVPYSINRDMIPNSHN